jgi:hypothetical protein
MYLVNDLVRIEDLFRIAGQNRLSLYWQGPYGVATSCHWYYIYMHTHICYVIQSEQCKVRPILRSCTRFFRYLNQKSHLPARIVTVSLSLAHPLGWRIDLFDHTEMNPQGSVPRWEWDPTDSQLPSVSSETILLLFGFLAFSPTFLCFLRSSALGFCSWYLWNLGLCRHAPYILEQE